MASCSCLILPHLIDHTAALPFDQSLHVSLSLYHLAGCRPLEQNDPRDLVVFGEPSPPARNPSSRVQQEAFGDVELKWARHVLLTTVFIVLLLFSCFL